MKTTTSDPVLAASDEPNLKALLAEYQGCSPRDQATNWNRAEQADNIRFCRWENQNAEGTKPDTAAAFPWPRASDVRLFVADEVINEDEALFMNGFWRALAMMQLSALDANEQESVAYLHKLLTWLTRGRMRKEIWREARHYKQWRQHYGWVVMQVDWERKVQNKAKTITLQEITALAAKAPPQSPISALPEMIMTPALESQAVEFFQQLFDLYVKQQFAGIDETEVPEFSAKRAGKAVRDLRQTGQAEVPMPYLCKNEPCLVALEPWVDIVLPGGALDIQNCRVVFRVEWIGETDLRARIVTEGYDPDWVERALTTRGQVDYRQSMPVSTHRGAVTLATAAGDAGSGNLGFGESQQRIQLLHAYVWAYDEDNIPSLYCTTFSPHFIADKLGRPSFAKHELLDYPHGKRPFVHGKREYWSRELTASRGVPEIVQPLQRIMKTQFDAAVDLASISVNPGWAVPMGVKWKYGPGAQNPTRPGQKPEALDVPTQGLPVAMALIENSERRVDNYFGRLAADVPPARAQVKQQLEMQDDLIFWTEVFEQTLQLAMEYLTPQEFTRVTGAQPDPNLLSEGIDRLYDFFLTMDVKDLDPEMMATKLEAVGKMAQFDRGGVIDYNKLLQMGLVAIDPSLAQRLIKPSGEASRQMFEKVRGDFAQMALGNEAIYDEQMNPSAGMELQFAQQVMEGNPQYQQRLTTDARFRELVENWNKNKQQSLKQQENVAIGRSGVKPIGAGGQG